MTRSLRLCLALCAFPASLPLVAQQNIFSHKDDKPKFSTPLPYRTFHLANVAGKSEANEIAASVRRVIDSEAVTLAGNGNDLLVIGSPEQLAAAADLIKILDHPRPVYHLSFTVTETDGAKHSVRHYALHAAAGEQAQLNATRNVPVTPLPTPPVNKDEQAPAPAKIEHLLTGMTFLVTLQEYNGGVRLDSKINYMDISPEPPPPGTMVPIVDENDLFNTSVLRWGKPIVLGVIDPPNSNRHIEIEVVADQPQS